MRDTVDKNRLNEFTNKSLEIVQKVQKEENRELKIMLAILDPEHSIIVDENIGLIGEFEDTKDDKELEPVVKNIYDNIKCGDYFQVVSNQGLIVLEEKVVGVYRIIASDGKATNKYIFILKDFTAKTILQDMLEEEPDKAVVVYDASKEEYETNCLELANKFKFIENIDINDNLGFTVYYNDEMFYGLDINYLNRIGVLRAR